MRSYYEHLENVLHAGLDGNILIKPTFRSSAIFPVMQLPGKIATRILYFGYWILKRHIKEITCVTTLRSEEGKVLIRNITAIHEPKAFRVELSNLMALADLRSDIPFVGSIELEFFSTKHLVYPYPAAIINYYGPAFSTIVHTAQRVYNDIDDMAANSKTTVPESGFNIYANDGKEPFISFVNGPEAVSPFVMELTFINHRNEKREKSITIDTLAPYQATFLYPGRQMDLKPFLDGKPGTMKIRYNLPWIYPRLVVGNLQEGIPGLSITHSYYDCSEAKQPNDYWVLTSDDTYPATLLLPIKVAGSFYTRINFYPIYSPSALTFDAAIYDADGHLLGKKEDIIQFSHTTGEYTTLSMNTLCKELNITPQEHLALRLVVRSTNENPIPARIKVAVDIGKNTAILPCNICTNLIPYNPAFDAKPKSFRWMPILSDRPHSSAWILDSSPRVVNSKPSACEITFFRESDAATLKRQYTIPPHGFLVITPDNDKELEEFLAHNVGWLTIQTDNPYLSLFYFSEGASGIIGGDHGF